MIELEITREADALLTVLYREYLRRRECGSPKRSAAFFGDAQQIKALMPDLWHIEDIKSVCWELCHADLMQAMPGDNSVNEAELTDKAIIWNQQRFRRGLSDVLAGLETMRGIIKP